MKFSTGIASVAALAFIQPALAHYRFVSFIAPDGTVTGEYEYVRQNTNINSPVEDVTSTDMRCNVGADTGSGTSTYTVNAGDSVGFKADQAAFHPGPFGVYMSKASGDISEYTGDGGWFKIYETTADIAEGSFSFDATIDTLNFDLPSTIESGDYLLRIEHIGLHSAGAPQFYISCAQLTVENGGSASPETVSIPGYLAVDDPSIILNIYYPIPTSYDPPGPDVFTDDGSAPSNPSSAAPSSAAPSTSAAASSAIPSSSAAVPSSSAGSPEPSSSVVEPSSSADVPAPSSADVPAPSSADAPAPSSADVPAPSSVAEPSSSVVVPSSSGAVPTSSAAVPSSSAAVPSSAAAPPSSSAAVPTSSAAEPAPTGTTCSKDAYNCCMDAYNACLDQAHSQKSGGGDVDFSTCQAELTTCTSSITRRHARDLLKPFW